MTPGATSSSVAMSMSGSASTDPRSCTTAHRRTRRGGGTFEKTLQGMRRLHDHGIDFNTITVLTADSLAYPDELFDFFVENGVTSVSFNVEEIEGPHVASSLARSGTEERFRRFYSRFLDLVLAADRPMEVREFETAQNRSRSVARPPSRGRRSAGPSPSSTSTARATSRPIRPSCSASVGRAMAASRSATWRGIPSRRCWRSRVSSRSTTRSAAASNGVTKPAAMRRSAAADRRATSSSRTATSPRPKRCRAACTSR